MPKIKQFIPDGPDGVMKNISELIEEYRNGNIRCMMLCYRRKKDGSTRTFFVGADDPHLFMTLVRLEHDMLDLYATNSDIQEYEPR